MIVPCARAVIVGLCAHGLTLARALHKSGISILGLESDASLPGVVTKAAEVKIVRDINGPDDLSRISENQLLPL